MDRNWIKRPMDPYPAIVKYDFARQCVAWVEDVLHEAPVHEDDSGVVCATYEDDVLHIRMHTGRACIGDTGLVGLEHVFIHIAQGDASRCGLTTIQKEPRGESGRIIYVNMLEDGTWMDHLRRLAWYPDLRANGATPVVPAPPY